MPPPRHSLPARLPLLALLGWCLVLALTAGGLAAYQRLVLISELEQESTVLQRLAAQRADQHDAHLTALSAIAVAEEGRGFALFLDVATSIARFYPRIDDVQLVPLDGSPPIGLKPTNPALAEAARQAAHASDGRLMLLPDPVAADHYLLVKRSPNTDAARYALALAIDAGRLIGDAGPFWARPGVALRLSLPGGGVLIDHPAAAENIRFSRPLGSVSQPLLLETGMAIGPADLFAPLRTALSLLAASLAYGAALAALAQRARTRAAMQAARLSALESRLTHASRVNALGEMASGMAHELTQPLTAILSGMQAGRRLLQRGDTETLAPVLDDAIAQARRASAILERLRNWSRPQPRPAQAVDLRAVVETVRSLLAAEAQAKGARLDLNLPERPVAVRADPVEMEQVVFNLVRNAIEAGATQVTVTLRNEGQGALMEISDNGPGVAEDLRPRLFTPFTTTRADGTGLGLALSQRLVERAGGEIFLADTGPGATFRVVLPLEDKP